MSIPPSSSKQIKIGAILSYINIFINIVFGLVYTPWMISSIGRESYGLYTLANSVIALFVFDFGLSAAVTRFLAKYIAEDRQDKADNCIGLVYRLYIIIDAALLVLLTLVYFFIPQIYRELTPSEIEQFKVVYAISAVYSVVSFPFIPVNGVLTAYERFVPLKICDIVNKVLTVVLVSLCLVIGWGLYALVTVNAISGIIMIALKLLIVNKTPLTINFHYRNTGEFKEIITYSGWTTLISVSQRLLLTIAPTILGIFSGSTSIAIFGIASTIEGYVYGFSNAIGGMFLPRVSRIVANDKEEILPLMIRVGRLQLMVVGLIVFGFLCVGKDFIFLWVGDGFKDSFICALLIIIALLYTTPHEIGIQDIYAQNRVKDWAVIHIISGVLNVVLYVLFVQFWDVKGVALALLISLITRTILLEVLLNNKLGINIFEFLRSTYLSLSTGMIVSVLVYYILFALTPLSTISNGWLALLFKGTLFVILYFACVGLFTNEYERKLVLQPLNFIKNKILFKR